MATCPICRKPVGPRKENPAFPFCSQRCRLLDLGKWLGGDYRIPGRPEETDELAEPAPAEAKREVGDE